MHIFIGIGKPKIAIDIMHKLLFVEIFVHLLAVYNWTVDDVGMWLINEVELPQYADTFRINTIDGRVLPRFVLTIELF